MDEIEIKVLPPRSPGPQECSFRFRAPPPIWISRAVNAPFREIFQHAFRHGGVDFFWNDPITTGV